ncbi:MAG: UDP-N-acetylglucosamine pyrophosphorylase [Deltaproteobacteria bacterium]|nr:UDP-N-acetylglucosamine pyrophosphorylase [Deltaproteobacteria bacterium]
MEPTSENQERIVRLINKGVEIRNPLTIDIGEDVEIDRISGNGVRIYPGCRIYGRETVIAGGACLGREGPVTIEDCQIGPKVELKAGYFKQAAFLEMANMGSGAHVREGCILEEEANGAHCVGLKQTILFPFVTLGSLINFCDCFMAGGTSRKDHSEVGSSYIHFNFTPSGDKTTASLIGDVPRGVMLNQPPIFLGGQGGMVGPLRLNYGNVIAAGAILRKDVPECGKLIITKTHRAGLFPFVPDLYSGLPRILENNIRYLANLAALEQWYIHVRQPFFHTQELGNLIYQGALDKLALAKKERIKRLRVMTDKIEASLERHGDQADAGAGKRELCDAVEEIAELFSGELAGKTGLHARDAFLEAFTVHQKECGGTYVETVQSLPGGVSEKGTAWLQETVDAISRRAAALVPSLGLFKDLTREAR